MKVNGIHVTIFFLMGILIGIILCMVIGYYLLKEKFATVKKQVETVDRDQVKNMLSAMGKKPSEEQVNRILSNVENTKTKPKKTRTRGRKATRKKKKT